MRVVKISTTAWAEEDFYLLTTLGDQDIVEVIQPIVNAERDGEEFYDNQLLIDKLKRRYPLDHVEMHQGFNELVF